MKIVYESNTGHTEKYTNMNNIERIIKETNESKFVCV